MKLIKLRSAIKDIGEIYINVEHIVQFYPTISVGNTKVCTTAYGDGVCPVLDTPEEIIEKIKEARSLYNIYKSK